MNLIKKVKENNKFKKLKERITGIVSSVMGVLIIGESKVFAADTNSNTQSIDSFINFACDWLTKIGGVIALVGGVMFALRMAKRRCRRQISWTYDFNGRIYASCNSTI